MMNLLKNLVFIKFYLWNFQSTHSKLRPKGVESLHFGGFNQPIQNLDLKGVKSLHFNQPIQKLDLKGVENLIFEDHFNEPVAGLNLKGVKSLSFGSHFNQPVAGLDFGKLNQ